MNRFQITTRQNTLNVNQHDFDKVNADINDFCDKAEVNPESFKELFYTLLDFARFNVKSQVKSDESENEISLKSAEIDQLKLQIENLQKSNEELEHVNKDLFAKELARSEAEENSDPNILPVPATPEQVAVLAGIAQNRFDAKYDDELASPAEIVKRIVFRESYLYNHFGVFHTGL